jgi:Uma2 family endonuclease
MAISPSLDFPRRRFTVEEYHTMIETGILTEQDRVQLIAGEIVEMPPIGSKHASHVKKIASLFRGLEPEHVLVSVQDPIQLPPDSEPEPDIALVEPREDFYRDAHPTADDIYLLVEVADTTLELDRETKIPLYGRHDIPAVWLVDLESERLEIYEEPVDGEYTVIRRPPTDREIRVTGFEDLSFAAGECLIGD